MNRETTFTGRVWNISTFLTLIVADPTPTGLKERARISGRFDPDDYMARVGEAFDPVGVSFKLLPKAGAKPATTDDLARMLGELKLPFDRAAAGGLRAKVSVAVAQGAAREVAVEVRPTADGRRLVVAGDGHEYPADPADRKRLDAELDIVRAAALPLGPLHLSVEGGRVRWAVEVFNDFGSADALDNVVRVNAAAVLNLRIRFENRPKK